MAHKTPIRFCGLANWGRLLFPCSHAAHHPPRARVAPRTNSEPQHGPKCPSRSGRRAEVVAASLRAAESRLLGGPQTATDRVLQDVRGTQVFECESRPVFVSLDFDSAIGRSPERFLQLIAAATKKDISLDDKEELAFELSQGRSLNQRRTDGYSC
jgi:hypothetical protein